MVAVTIDSGPVAATDPLRIVPKEKWRDLMLARRDFMEVRLQRDCRCLVEFVNDAKLMFETLNFASVEAMIREGYGLEPAEIDVAVEWLRLNPSEDPVELDTAIRLGKHGGKRVKGQGSQRTLKRGDNPDYWLAVIERDYPDIKVTRETATKKATELGLREKRKRCCPNCGHTW